MPGYDLHTHSTHSDGTTTVEANVSQAVELGLAGLAVTDHDTMDGVARAETAAAGTGLVIIPGTEFSAELDATSVHVLGYWTDPADLPLSDEMDRLRRERERRGAAIVAKFNALGIPLTLARVSEIAGTAPIGRPHIAAAVVETGLVADTRSVFDDYLADGGPAYVPKYAVDPVAAVELLKGAGGVAVLAHPGLFGSRTGDLMDDAVIEEMAGVGMAGIEADHPDHTVEQRDRYRDMARALGLVVTAGSDYHGEAKVQELGAVTASADVVAALEDRR